jgi:diadenylate cyclase
MELLRISFLKFGVVDLVDILLVAFFIYRFFLLILGTRSFQILIGVFLVFLVGVAAFWFQLEAVKWLITNVAAVGVIVLVIVFQPELRRALAQIGQHRLFRFFFKYQPPERLKEVVKGVEQLASRRYGALIVVEREANLNRIIETGKILNASLSCEALVTIFTPHTPLHDGAVVIRGDEIVACACTLPLTQNPAFHHTYGTRHKAAVGVTEDSDAIVVVVSEETGRISIASDGLLNKGLEVEMLLPALTKLFKTG